MNLQDNKKSSVVKLAVISLLLVLLSVIILFVQTALSYVFVADEVDRVNSLSDEQVIITFFPIFIIASILTPISILLNISALILGIRAIRRIKETGLPGKILAIITTIVAIIPVAIISIILIFAFLYAVLPP